jgi:hypothetical protein
MAEKPLSDADMRLFPTRVTAEMLGDQVDVRTAIQEITEWSQRLVARRCTLKMAPDIMAHVIAVWARAGRTELQVRWFHNGAYKEAYVMPGDVNFCADPRSSAFGHEC